MYSGSPVGAAGAPHQDRYRIVSIPATDSLFRHTVDRHVRSVRHHGATLRATRRSLRQRYPEAELCCQRDGGVRGESVELWFAYRDGRAESHVPLAPWWDDPGVARAVVDATGCLVDANEPCRRLLGVPTDAVGGIMLRDRVSRALYADLRVASKRLPAGRDWTGTVPLRLPDGRRRDVEFHARREATGQRFEVALRSTTDRDHANDWLALERSTLGSVPPAVLAELFRSGVRHKLGPGERLATSLTGEGWVALVTAGITRLYVAMDGFEPTLAYGGRGALVGTHAMPPTESFLVGLQSVTPSVVLQLSSRRVEELASANPAVARALADDTRLHLHDVVRSFAARAGGNLRQRLAREIVVLSDLEVDDELLAVTEQQLADGVGSIRESIGRSIGDLRRDGSIATTRHGLLILDRGRLRTLAHVGEA